MAKGKLPVADGRELGYKIADAGLRQNTRCLQTCGRINDHPKRQCRGQRASFAANRQIYGRWQNVLPSRFVDELPHAHVDAVSETGYGQQTGGGVKEGWSLFDAYAPGAGFNSGYASPGWKRAQERQKGGVSPSRGPVIEGEARLVAKSGAQDQTYAIGERVFHQKFGNGNVTVVDGNKLTIAFDRAGEKRVVDSFVERV